ncbi:MAG TPA: hotdog domain-containing protein [Candidatus Lustribacter sp.]|nr:hotdog domain-containing protein [Candidatus Lustribacter sp.]
MTPEWGGGRSERHVDRPARCLPRRRVPRDRAFGGTVSGPSMMSLVDVGMHLLLAQIGPVALAVTTSISINFLRMPTPR